MGRLWLTGEDSVGAQGSRTGKGQRGEAGTPGGSYPPGELDTTLNPGPSPLTWVPFWKPPNITDNTISTTISSTIHSRQPAARDLGQRRRRPP
jgi:hypothetical protein